MPSLACDFCHSVLRPSIAGTPPLASGSWLSSLNVLRPGPLRPFFSSTRAASIPSSRPPDLAAGARRGCQGWTRLRGHPKGLALTGPSTAARLSGWDCRRSRPVFLPARRHRTVALGRGSLAAAMPAATNHDAKRKMTLQMATGASGLQHRSSLLGCFAGARAPQAVAGEIDAVGVVHDAIEDGVGIGRIADQVVPLVDGDLAGDDR
jgi:hypothetical protein